MINVADFIPVVNVKSVWGTWLGQTLQTLYKTYDTDRKAPIVKTTASKTKHESPMGNYVGKDTGGKPKKNPANAAGLCFFYCSVWNSNWSWKTFLEMYSELPFVKFAFHALLFFFILWSPFFCYMSFSYNFMVIQPPAAYKLKSLHTGDIFYAKLFLTFRGPFPPLAFKPKVFHIGSFFYDFSWPWLPLCF